jgi:hypothetical protein
LGQPLRYAAMHSILIGTDHLGEFPCHLRDGEKLPTDGVSWRLVVQTDDDEEAAKVMALVAGACRSRRGTSAPGPA